MINAEIVKITPGATYQEVVYDQYVTVLLPSGIKIELFDATVNVASENDLGKHREVTIIVHSMDDFIVEQEQVGFKRVGENLELVGKVAEIGVGDRWHVKDGYDNLIRLDLGYGSVLLYPTMETVSQIQREEIKCGDLLGVVPNMIELADISDN